MDVANLMHPCFAEWFMDMVGITRISATDAPAITDCIGETDPLYREPGVVISCVGTPWNTAPALSIYEEVEQRMNRPPSPDLPPLSIFSSSFRAEASPLIDLRQNEELMETVRRPANPTADSPLSHRSPANTFLTPRSPSPEYPDPMDIDVEVVHPITNEEHDTEESPPSPVQPPDTHRRRPRDEFPKEKIAEILRRCHRDLPFNISNRIVIKGKDVPSVANAIITLLQIASRYKMMNRSGQVAAPQLEGIFSIEGPFWRIMSYPSAETHVFLRLHPVTGLNEYSHGMGVYINVLSFAVSKVIADAANRYENLPNDSPLKTPFFPDENTPLHSSCIRHLSEGSLFSLLILVSEGNADLSPLNPFLIIVLAAGRGKENSAIDNITASIIETLDPHVYEIMEDYLKLKRGQRMVDTSNPNRVGNHMLDPVAQLLMNYGGGIPVSAVFSFCSLAV